MCVYKNTKLCGCVYRSMRSLRNNGLASREHQKAQWEQKSMLRHILGGFSTISQRRRRLITHTNRAAHYVMWEFVVTVSLRAAYNREKYNWERAENCAARRVFRCIVWIGPQGSVQSAIKSTKNWHNEPRKVVSFFHTVLIGLATLILTSAVFSCVSANETVDLFNALLRRESSREHSHTSRALCGFTYFYFYSLPADQKLIWIRIPGFALFN